jgi:hypothetical protein
MNSLKQRINYVVNLYKTRQKKLGEKDSINNFSESFSELNNQVKKCTQKEGLVSKSGDLHKISPEVLKEYNKLTIDTANLLIKLYQLERDKKVKLKPIYCEVPEKHRPRPNTGIDNHKNKNCWVNATIQLMYRIPQFRAVVMALDKINVDTKLRPRPVLTKLAEIFKKLDTGPNVSSKEIDNFLVEVNKENNKAIKEYIRRNRNTDNLASIGRIKINVDDKGWADTIDMYSAILNVLAPWEYNEFSKDDSIRMDFKNDFRYTIQSLKKETQIYYKVIMLNVIVTKIPDNPAKRTLETPIEIDEYECGDYVLAGGNSVTEKVKIARLLDGTFDGQKYSLIGLIPSTPGHYVYYRFNDHDKFWYLYNDNNLDKLSAEKFKTTDVKPHLLLYRKDGIDNIYKAARVEYFALPSDNLDSLEQNDETQEYLDPITSKKS